VRSRSRSRSNSPNEGGRRPQEVEQPVINGGGLAADIGRVFQGLGFSNKESSS